MFKKPAVPGNNNNTNVQAATTMGTFLYGNNNRQANNLQAASGNKVKKSVSTKG